MTKMTEEECEKFVMELAGSFGRMADALEKLADTNQKILDIQRVAYGVQHDIEIDTDEAGWKDKVSEFADKIKHGDDKHRDWLRRAADAFCQDEPIPDAN